MTTNQQYIQIETWVVAPYKKPKHKIPENEEFNNHVSMVHIQSEHAIGFHKGRFHSLKHLRIWINDERSHKFATYWIVACIGIHAFAMQCEDKERSDDKESEEDLFITEGVSSSESDGIGPPREPASQQWLRVGKARREELKRALFRAKERRRRQREEQLGEVSFSGEDLDIEP